MCGFGEPRGSSAKAGQYRRCDAACARNPGTPRAECVFLQRVRRAGAEPATPGAHRKRLNVPSSASCPQGSKKAGGEPLLRADNCNAQNLDRRRRALILDLTSSMLEDLGCESSPQTMVRMPLRASPRTPLALITDVQMPGMRDMSLRRRPDSAGQTCGSSMFGNDLGGKGYTLVRKPFHSRNWEKSSVRQDRRLDAGRSRHVD